MFGIESLSGSTQAAALVGIVLLQASVLYVGYGGMERVFGPKITEVVEEEQ
jgi:hypothetical protein